MGEKEEFEHLLLTINQLFHAAHDAIASSSAVLNCELDAEYACPVRDSGLSTAVKQAICFVLDCEMRPREEQV